VVVAWQSAQLSWGRVPIFPGCPGTKCPLILGQSARLSHGRVPSCPEAECPFFLVVPGQNAHLFWGRVPGCRMAECPVVLKQSAHFSWGRVSCCCCPRAECLVVLWQSAQLSRGRVPGCPRAECPVVPGKVLSCPGGASAYAQSHCLVQTRMYLTNINGGRGWLCMVWPSSALVLYICPRN